MNIQLLSERVLLVTAAVVTSAIAAGETIRYDFARELPQWTIAPAGTIEATAIAGGVRLKVVQAQNRGRRRISSGEDVAQRQGDRTLFLRRHHRPDETETPL